MEPTTALTLLLGLIFIGANWIGKKWGFTQKQVAIGVAIFGAIGYTLFDYFTPAEIKVNIIIQITSAVGTGKLIYDMISKDK